LVGENEKMSDGIALRGHPHHSRRDKQERPNKETGSMDQPEKCGKNRKTLVKFF
jgi:hypothetical protein